MVEKHETFNEVMMNYDEKLDLFTKAITRAHGKNHPEAFAVRDLYVVIKERVEEAGPGTLDLDAEFNQLRKITNNYTIPDDVCETYAGTYTMLSEVDHAYHA
jgi:iron-sulfur cluster repair protein YtfE (RIC family)